ncbi:hypothetical protein Nmel_016395 [Mimus melanotis]
MTSPSFVSLFHHPCVTITFHCHGVTVPFPFCHPCTAVLPSLCHRCVAVALPLCHHSITVTLLLCHHCTAIVSPFCHCCVTFALP